MRYDASQTNGSANVEGDYPGSNMRVVRGGSFRDVGVNLRSASRGQEMQTRGDIIGFRVVAFPK